jgi:cytochrome c5
MRHIRPVLAAVSPLVLGLFAAFTAAAGEQTFALADAPGRDATVASCAICHSLDYVSMNAAVMNRTAWDKSIRKMVDKFGAPISAENMQVILDYLALHYSAGP